MVVVLVWYVPGILTVLDYSIVFCTVVHGACP